MRQANLDGVANRKGGVIGGCCARQNGNREPVLHAGWRVLRDEQELVGDIWSVIGDGFNFPCGTVPGVGIPELDLEATHCVFWALEVAIGDKPEGLADEEGVALGWGANGNTRDQG